VILKAALGHGLGVFLSACAPTAPCPASAAPSLSIAPAKNQPPSPEAQPLDGLSVLLRPAMNPAGVVHVELDLAAPGTPERTWHLRRGSVGRIAHASARDEAGSFDVATSAKADGVDLELSRPPRGALHLAYDVLSGGEAPDDPLGTLVVDDRFRGSGGGLIAVPEAIEGVAMSVRLRIDGSALRASGAASSLGVGSTRRTTMPLGGLAYVSFLAGSLGGAVIDDPGAGHDEGAWLGYTAFDPRTTVAELAQIRSALHELFKEQPGDAFTYLLVSQTRPIGSFSTTPRWSSALLQVGPSEPWSRALRLSMTQQLARRWVGGQLSVATSPGREAEGWWFSDGVSRYVAMQLLARLGLLPPEDVRQTVAGELAVVATSPHRALDLARLANLATSHPVARATLMARGALYALRESAQIHARTKGEKGLTTLLASLAKQAETGGRRSLSVADWLELLGKDDPDAARSFDAIVTRGESVTLPADALGPCFRAQAGEYVAYDAGFDVEATRVSESGRVVGLRAGGPAAKAGLTGEDIVEAMKGRDGDADVRVELTVVRAGKKVSLSYAPRGDRGKGQTWSRLAGMRDEQCGPPP